MDGALATLAASPMLVLPLLAVLALAGAWRLFAAPLRAFKASVEEAALLRRDVADVKDGLAAHVRQCHTDKEEIRGEIARLRTDVEILKTQAATNSALLQQIVSKLGA